MPNGDSEPETSLSWLKFYPADHVQDSRILSLEAKGAWIDLICQMFAQREHGVLEISLASLVRMWGISEEKVQEILDELRYAKMGVIIRNGNGTVTVKSRRMQREAKARAKSRSTNALRQQRYRERLKAKGKQRNAGVTDRNGVTVTLRGESRDQSLETREEDSPSIPLGDGVSVGDLGKEVPERFKELLVALIKTGKMPHLKPRHLVEVDREHPRAEITEEAELIALELEGMDTIGNSMAWLRKVASRLEVEKAGFYKKRPRYGEDRPPPLSTYEPPPPPPEKRV